MSDIEKIDFRSYTQGVGIAAPYAKTVASLLVNVAPKDLGEAERRALMRVVACADDVEEIRWERAQRAPARIAPLRNELVRSIAALHGALVAFATVPPTRGDRGTRAAKLLSGMFPEGTTFVRNDTPILWQDARLRLRWVDERSLTDEVAQVLGGPELLDAVRDATTEVGEALGVGTTAREVPSRDALRAARVAFIRATGAYGRALAASVDDDDPASVQRFLDAVAPLDEYRTTRTSAEDEEDADEELVTEPLSPAEPDVPAVA